LDLNKLSKIVSSFTILKATPPRVVGAGVVGIFNGAGVMRYLRMRNAKPNTRIAVAR